jgi:hypothetical protein
MDQHRLHQVFLEGHVVGSFLRVPDAYDFFTLNQYPLALLALGEQLAGFPAIETPLHRNWVRGIILRQLRVVDGGAVDFAILSGH